MFPVFIASKNNGAVRVVLWQKNHYEYEIDVTGHEGFIKLPDTEFEEAIKIFDNLNLAKVK